MRRAAEDTLGLNARLCAMHQRLVMEGEGAHRRAYASVTKAG